MDETEAKGFFDYFVIVFPLLFGTGMLFLGGYTQRRSDKQLSKLSFERDLKNAKRDKHIDLVERSITGVVDITIMSHDLLSYGYRLGDKDNVLPTNSPQKVELKKMLEMMAKCSSSVALINALLDRKSVV